MKSDFLLAITQLSAEKNLSKEVVIGAIEAALVSAYRKESFAANQNISVKLNPSTGKVEVCAEKTIVEHIADSRREISLDEASQLEPNIKIGDTILVEATPHNAGRIAAQTAKQVILQRLHEAEHSAVYEEYTTKEGDVVAGVVQRIESKQIFVDLGRTEAILPAVEQVRNERYRVGQRLKVYLLEVVSTSRGPQVVVSRSHPHLLRRLFELEIPEVYNGIVEIKSVAREASSRSKVAVAARQDGIDPVGCCVGMRGIRIQNVMNELNGERVDVVLWDPNTSTFIANALSPAQVSGVELGNEESIATVIVPDRQLSLAIGKEGQNVRLAAKLTGWRIDIKSISAAEAERAEKGKPLTEMEEEAGGGEELPAETPVKEPALVSNKATEEATEPSPPPDTTFAPPTPSFEQQVTIKEKPQLRFAEEVLVPPPIKQETKLRKKKKKGTQGKGSAEDGIRLKKRRRQQETSTDDEEY